jgi:putative CocE/NonD family hydrolase
VGEDAWRTTATWPPPGVAPQPFYLRAQTELAPEAPHDPVGADVMQVDFTATTGPLSRWRSTAVTVNGPVEYAERSVADRRLLSYTSAPLAADLRVTGDPVATLHLASTERDGIVIVYLEDVAPDGRVTYVDEGELRLIHRRVSAERPPYAAPGPYHSFLRKDALPMVPGQVAEVSFALEPIAVVFHAGHRLRVSIAGADAGTFARIPAVGDPTLTVHRSAALASRVTLPIGP